jgi:hypothetical protein
MQVRVARYKLGKGISNGDNGAAKLLALHARSHPQGPRACHLSALCREGASKLNFHSCNYIVMYDTLFRCLGKINYIGTLKQEENE